MTEPQGTPIPRCNLSPSAKDTKNDTEAERSDFPETPQLVSTVKILNQAYWTPEPTSVCQVLVVFYRFRELKEFASDHIASWEQC